MTFGQKLKKLRTDKALTQDELAKKLYVTRTAISKWETDRGYPGIDSLKAIAKYFAVPLDALLVSEEMLVIAEAETKYRDAHFRGLVFALLDMSLAMLMFLPFFAENADGIIKSVSLIALSDVRCYLKLSYFAVVLATVLTGALSLCVRGVPNKIKINISLALGIASALLFVISSQPYAATFAFVIVIIKAFILINRR